jgi:hypothetical protein
MTTKNEIDSFDLRRLQLESARVLSSVKSLNVWIFNNKVNHNSTEWYKSVIRWYVQEYGDLPSVIGPGKDVKLIQDV